MTDEVEMLARRLRDNPDKPVQMLELAEELGIPRGRMPGNVADLLKRDGFFDLGDHRLMFTGNSDMAAFEIFRMAAPHVQFEEFIRFREQPHLLMRLSRDRAIALGGDHEKLLKDAVREKERNRGNSVF